MSNDIKYNQMFDYLRSPTAPQESAGLLVFGRQDQLVAHAVGNAIMEGLSDYVVISGGVGKDSKGLRIPEAVYLREVIKNEFPNISTTMLTEKRATNGRDNVRYSLDLLDKHGLPYSHALTAVAHATSARRLAETVRHEAIVRGTPIETVAGIASDYDFNPSNPSDQHEARAELLRLAHWPALGALQPQTDIPENLVDFATEIHGHIPKPPSRLATAVFSCLPYRLQRAAFKVINPS